jgi:hypothetical protein
LALRFLTYLQLPTINRWKIVTMAWNLCRYRGVFSSRSNWNDVMEKLEVCMCRKISEGNLCKYKTLFQVYFTTQHRSRRKFSRKHFF